MAVGAFTLVDSGLLGHLDGSIDVGAGTPFYAILTTHAGGAPDEDLDIDYADISAQETVDGDYAPQDVVLTTTETGAGTGIVEVDLNPAEINFGDTVTITARYLWILAGAEGAPVGTDRILGFMDLNDLGADVSSIASDFKVSANANGLYRVAKA